jgi:hypothetical protein
MLIFRKILSFLIFLVLIVSLTLTSLFISVGTNIKNKDKVNNWINKPVIYTSLINKITTDANQEVKNQYNISGLNSYLTGNIKSLYPESTFNSNVSTVINSNYSWLKGNSSSPMFSINFAGLKSTLANRISSYSENYLEKLPLCSELELIELKNNLSGVENCTPPTIKPSAVSYQIKNDILNSNIFIKGNNFTADSVNINGLNGSKPYYLKYSKLPKYYKLIARSELTLGPLSLVIALILVFLYPNRKGGLKLVFWSLMISGLLILLSTAVIDQGASKLISKANANTSLSSFSKPIDSFISHIKSSINSTSKVFAIIYIALSVIALLTVFILTKVNKRKDEGSVYTKRRGGTLGSGTFHLF